MIIKIYSILVIFALSIINTTIGHTQSSSIEIGTPYAYPGLDNHMNIIVENIPCENLFISTDHGLIKKGNKPCSYRYQAKTIKEEHLHLHKVSGLDTIFIESRRILIRKWPEQYATFGNQRSGKIMKSIFFLHADVSCKISGFDMSGYHKVDSYKVTVIRYDKVIMEFYNFGGKFEKATKEKLGSIKKYDQVKFTEIYAFIPGEEKSRKLNDVNIIID